MKKRPTEFRQGDSIVIIDGFENIPRPCKVKRVEAGGIIGEDERGRRWFAPTAGRDDRYFVPDLFHPLRIDRHG